MKVIVASFQCESNSKASYHPQRSDFEYFKGEDIFKKLQKPKSLGKINCLKVKTLTYFKYIFILLAIGRKPRES